MPDVGHCVQQSCGQGETAEAPLIQHVVTNRSSEESIAKSRETIILENRARVD